MSYKPNGEKREDAVIPKLPCCRCQASTKTPELGVFGGLCGRCFGEYAQKPFPIPRRVEQ